MRGDIFFMATSSITHNFVLSDKESVERFINAIELAELDKANSRPSHVSHGRLLTDRKEIIKLMNKRK